MNSPISKMVVNSYSNQLISIVLIFWDASLGLYVLNSINWLSYFSSFAYLPQSSALYNMHMHSEIVLANLSHLNARNIVANEKVRLWK
jgi:hypothetical protein